MAWTQEGAEWGARQGPGRAERSAGRSAERREAEEQREPDEDEKRAKENLMFRAVHSEKECK